MFDYPVILEPDDDTILLTFADLPGATFGEDEADARARGQDALETVLQALIDDRAPVPTPSRPDGRPTVSPSLLGVLKLSIYGAMRQRGWRKADLARALAVNPRQIDRLLDLRHGSTVDQLEAALAACGQKAEVELAAIDGRLAAA